MPKGCVSLLRAAAALFKRIAVYAFFDGRICFMCADVDGIERAEMLGTQIMSTLFHRAVDVRILLFVHSRFSFPCGRFRCRKNIIPHFTGIMHPYAFLYKMRVLTCVFILKNEILDIWRIWQRNGAFGRTAQEKLK